MTAYESCLYVIGQVGIVFSLGVWVHSKTIAYAGAVFQDQVVQSQPLVSCRAIAGEVVMAQFTQAGSSGKYPWLTGSTWGCVAEEGHLHSLSFFLWLKQCPCCLSTIRELLDLLPARVSAAHSLGSTVLWSSVTCSLKAECLFPCYLTTLEIAEPEQRSCCCLDDKAVTCPDLVATSTWSLMHVGLHWKLTIFLVVAEYVYVPMLLKRMKQFI